MFNESILGKSSDHDKQTSSQQTSIIYPNNLFDMFEQAYEHPPEFNAKNISEALVFTYENSYVLKTARSEMHASFGEVVKSYGGLIPKLSANASIQANRFEGRGQSDANIGIKAEYTLYNGLGSSNSIKAAKAGHRAATYKYRDKESETFKNVIESFVRVVIQTKLVELNSQAIEYTRKLLAFVEAQMRLGVKTKADVKATEARLAGSEAAFFSALASKEATQAEFRSLTNCDITPGASYDKFLIFIFSLLPKSLPMLQKYALTENSKINAAIEQSKATRLNFLVAKASLGPTIIANAGYSLARPLPLEHNKSETEIRDLVTAGLQANFPIVDPGLWGGYTTVRHRDRAARHQLHYTTSSVKSACVRYWQEIIALKKSASALKKQILAASISLENYRKSFELGSASTTDVLKAENEFHDAKKKLLESRQKLISALLGALYVSNRLTPELLKLKVVNQVPEHLKAENLK